MHSPTVFRGLTSIAIVFLWGIVPHASAEQSASYRLYHEVPNYAARGPGVAADFQENEDGVTWIAAPIASSNFQIVSAPPVAVSSSSSSSSGSEEDIPVFGVSGGHRGAGSTLAALLAGRINGQTAARGSSSSAMHAAPQEPLQEESWPSFPSLPSTHEHPAGVRLEYELATTFARMTDICYIEEPRFFRLVDEMQMQARSAVTAADIIMALQGCRDWRWLIWGLILLNIVQFITLMKRIFPLQMKRSKKAFRSSRLRA
ncbi:MAG: hypothetical protein PHH13_04545 [Candidatus Peribacteraceae bacterium]|nr:hypothetical protein [Candidatus Peribacteraceae bacterium]